MNLTISLARSLPAVLLLAGCATTNETDPAKVSAADLRQGTRLQQHLAGRRQVLESLQARANELETQLMLDLGKLHQVERARTAASRESEAAQAQAREVAAQRAQAEGLLDQIARARAELEKAKAAAPAAAAEAERTKQQQLEQEVRRLEVEVGQISEAIRRTLRLREEQMLKEKIDR